MEGPEAMLNKCREITALITADSRFVPVLAAVTALSMCAGLNLAGAIILLACTVWLLLFSDDTLSVLCPVMLAVMGLTSYYNNYFELLRYSWVLLPAAAALPVHLFAYRSGTMPKGRMLGSLAAVSLSLVTGGIGAISAGEYFSGLSLYYIIGLGAGLVPVYLLLCSRLSRPRNYDIAERFASLLYALALLAALIIVLYYVRNWHRIMPDFKVPFISCRNFCTTMMLFGLPMCCLFARRNSWHLLSMAAIYLAMLAGGSRSAMLFGSAEVLMCLGYMYVSHPEKRREYRRIALVMCLPAVIVCYRLLDACFLGEGGRFAQHIIRPDEARPGFYRQGVMDFLSRPVFGWGIGNMKNAGIYQGINGSIIFYHNSVLQVMASLGLVGCAAYVWQLAERVRLLWLRRHKDVFVMAIAYVAINLMSLTNPGIFCPMPTAVLLVVMFAVTEFENSPVRVYSHPAYRRVGASGRAHAHGTAAGAPNR